MPLSKHKKNEKLFPTRGIFDAEFQNKVYSDMGSN